MKKSISYLLLSSVLAFSAMAAYADVDKETEANEMKADVNNDGKVSYEEFKNARMQYMEEHFKRRDTNGDGFIDADEKEAARNQMKSQHKDCKREDCKRKACKRKSGGSAPREE